MRHVWASVLAVLLVLSFFNDFLIHSRNRLAATIALQPFEKAEIKEMGRRKVLIASVYSTYPFSNKNLITLNVGADDGVKIGAAVTADGNMLLGQIVEISPNQSVAQTIFDKQWSLPVRIGAGQQDGLLVGGQEPKITLIDKNKQVLPGEEVFSVKKDFPYGMKIGAIGEVKGDSVHSFTEATLDLPYRPNDIKEAAIILN